MTINPQMIDVGFSPRLSKRMQRCKDPPQKKRCSSQAPGEGLSAKSPWDHQGDSAAPFSLHVRGLCASPRGLCSGGGSGDGVGGETTIRARMGRSEWASLVPPDRAAGRHGGRGAADRPDPRRVGHLRPWHRACAIVCLDVSLPVTVRAPLLRPDRPRHPQQRAVPTRPGTRSARMLRPGYQRGVAWAGSGRGRPRDPPPIGRARRRGRGVARGRPSGSWAQAREKEAEADSGRGGARGSGTAPLGGWSSGVGGPRRDALQPGSHPRRTGPQPLFLKPLCSFSLLALQRGGRSGRPPAGKGGARAPRKSSPPLRAQEVLAERLKGGTPRAQEVHAERPRGTPASSDPWMQMQPRSHSRAQPRCAPLLRLQLAG